LYEQCGDNVALSAHRATFSAEQRRNPIALLPLLNGLAENKDVAGAERAVQQFVDEGGVMDVYTFNALLGVYARCGDVAGVGGVVQRMTKAGVRPSAKTFVGLISAHQTALANELRDCGDGSADDLFRSAKESIDSVVRRMHTPADGGPRVEFGVADLSKLAQDAFHHAKVLGRPHGKLLQQLGLQRMEQFIKRGGVPPPQRARSPRPPQ
jgi:pentatricopeptide repeat protein